MNVAFLGSTSNLLRSIIGELIRQQFDLFTIIILGRRQPTFDASANLEFAYVDLNDPNTFSNASDFGIDLLVNLTGIQNIEPVKNLVETLGIESYLGAHTIKLYGAGAIGSSYRKLEQEFHAWVSTTGIRACSIRLNEIYGNRYDRYMVKLVDKILSSRIQFVYGFPGRKVQPIFIEDAAKLFSYILNNFCLFEGLHLDASGQESVTYRDLLKRIASELGRFVIIIPIPDWMVRYRYRKHPEIEHFLLGQYQSWDYQSDFTVLRLPFEFTTLKRGLSVYNDQRS